MKKLLLKTIILALCLSGCSGKAYVIVQIADAQLGFTAADKSQREGTEYVNDLTYESECLTKAVETVNRIHPDAVIFTGDQVNDPADNEQWNAFADIVSGIAPGIKVFNIPGNHDIIVKGNVTDSSPFTERYGSDRFVHSEKGVKIVGINTNLIQYDDSLEYDQTAWMKAVLEKTGDEKVTLIFGHHPFFMTDIDEPDSYFPIKRSKRHEYFELFSASGVDAVYAGHRHDSFEGEHDGIPMKTTTSVAFQIGDSKPSVRIITIKDGQISDELVEI